MPNDVVTITCRKDRGWINGRWCGCRCQLPTGTANFWLPFHARWSCSHRYVFTCILYMYMRKKIPTSEETRLDTVNFFSIVRKKKLDRLKFSSRNIKRDVIKLVLYICQSMNKSSKFKVSNTRSIFDSLIRNIR